MNARGRSITARSRLTVPVGPVTSSSSICRPSSESVATLISVVVPAEYVDVPLPTTTAPLMSQLVERRSVQPTLVFGDIGIPIMARIGTMPMPMAISSFRFWAM